MLLCFYELSQGNNKLNMDTFILFNHKKACDCRVLFLI